MQRKTLTEEYERHYRRPTMRSHAKENVKKLLDFALECKNPEEFLRDLDTTKQIIEDARNKEPFTD